MKGTKTTPLIAPAVSDRSLGVGQKFAESAARVERMSVVYNPLDDVLGPDGAIPISSFEMSQLSRVLGLNGIDASYPLAYPDKIEQTNASVWFRQKNLDDEISIHSLLVDRRGQGLDFHNAWLLPFQERTEAWCR